jgi:uroporphyrinogen-III synthase
MRILVTRPAEDAASFAQSLRALGHEPILSPALEIVALTGPGIDTSPYAAIVITSANAVRALSQRTNDRSARLVCVGSASAAAAEAMGYTDIIVSDGEGVAGLAAAIPRAVEAGGRLLYPSAENVAGDLEPTLAQQGFSVDRKILYRAVFAPTLTPEALSALKAGKLSAVTYFSVRSVAGTLAAARANGLDGQVQIRPAFCLSAAIAAAAAPSPTVIVPAATEAAMLACIGPA